MIDVPKINLNYVPINASGPLELRKFKTTCQIKFFLIKDGTEISLDKFEKPMAGSEPTTFRLQGECSSQAELHWHEVK